jgi:hypothetical protein
MEKPLGHVHPNSSVPRSEVSAGITLFPDSPLPLQLPEFNADEVASVGTGPSAQLP